MNSQNEQQTVPVSTKTASGVTPKWSFCAGDIAEAPEEENDDFCWNTASAVPINWDAEESSIMGEDEFAEDVVLEVFNEDKVPSPPRSPPSPEDNSLLYECYTEFRDMSCSATSRQKTGESPVRLSISVTNSARSSKIRRNKYNKRLTKSDHNRDLIRTSMKNILKA